MFAAKTWTTKDEIRHNQLAKDVKDLKAQLQLKKMMLDASTARRDAARKPASAPRQEHRFQAQLPSSKFVVFAHVFHCA